MKHYKLIVIGAGITGLSTGLAWQKVFEAHKNDVLILEKNPTVGGCVSSFARKGYIFDTTQIIPDVSEILKFFDIDIPLLKFENYYARLFLTNASTKATKIIPIPSSVEAFQKLLTERYPDDSKKIKRFFSYCLDMYNELNYLKTEPKWYQIPRILIKCPKIIANSGKTYKAFLGKFNFKNPELVQVLDIFSSFSGLSGNRCAALLTACAMVTTLRGSYRPAKGFIQFPIALKKKFLEKGGELRTKSPVSEILIKNGKTMGVLLENGEHITSDYVVCTADTKAVLNQLVGKNVFRKSGWFYYRKLKSVKMSPSGFAIQLGLDDHIDLNSLGFNCGYNVLTSGAKAHQRAFRKWENNEFVFSFKDFHLAVICPSLMTKGKPTLIIHVVPVPSNYWINLRENNYEDYKTAKENFAAFYIDIVEMYMIPNLKEHILYTNITTPATYKRYIGSPTGSQYDMLPVPSNFGKNRLPTRTPIKGLFLPKFSHGIWPCLQAGLQVIDMISGGKIMQGNSSLSKHEVSAIKLH